ncbi:MAG TPA: glycosyltransferase [Pyrinomonadaceae bacterium]|nr:glycosyltransferase [Pyrinomonadaceae bacterium]
MKKARRILVLTLSFGSGHVQAAHTIAREVERQAPDAEVRIVDAISDSRLLFRAGYVWPYWMMIRRAPALWDRFFARRTARMAEHTAPEWAFHWGCPHVFRTIVEFRPDAIVATEVAACEMAVMAKREGLTTAPIINVITDYEAEPVWVKPEVEVYAVADECVRDQLHRWGAAIESIVMWGIPTASAFRVRHEREATRARYRIKRDAPVVLLMGGGMGPTHMDEVVAQLCASKETMHIIAVTGHDARARRRLARLRALSPVSLQVLGWTEDVAALMQAASVLVTKPGGLTTAEAAMCALPVVIFDSIPGPERRNAARLMEAGAGVLTNGAQETAQAVLSLLRDDSRRQRMSACAATLARPEAAAMIARLTLKESLPAHEDLPRRMTA